MSIHASFTVTKDGLTGIELAIAGELSWEVLGPPTFTSTINQWMEGYAARRSIPWSVPIIWPPFAPFTKRVLEELQSLDFGETLSYQELAQVIDRPGAARAVGNACGRNPFPLILPCHRILAAGGRLGGFSCGLRIKEALLTHEEISWV